MKNLVYEKKGVKIFIDEFSEDADPRDRDNLGTIACFHFRYKLGDETDLNASMFSNWEAAEDYLYKENNNKLIMLPLYMYDHGGLLISVYPFSCPWDSGQIGYIYADYESVRKFFRVNYVTKKIRKLAEERLREEVRLYGLYLSGEVYYFETEDGYSCGGFLGYDFDEIVELAVKG